MKRGIRVALLALVGLSMMMSQAQAGSQNGAYVAAAAVSTTAGNRCVAQVNQCVALVGAFQVPAGPTTISVKISDVAGPGVGYVVCQRNGSNQPFCGDSTGDVEYTACSTASAKSFTNFKTTAPINVFIFSVDTDCDGIGTAGTYSVTW